MQEPETEVFDNDDDVQFQVELDDDQPALPPPRTKSTEITPQPQSAKSFEAQSQPPDGASASNYDGMNGVDFSNQMGGFNGVDPSQMMQMMQANGMNFNPMMGSLHLVPPPLHRL